IGGQTNAFTTMENTCYHAKVMDSQVRTMVDILSDIFLHSVFDANEIEKERPIIIQEIGMVEDNPEELIHIISSKNYWGDHSLGRSILGHRENILHFDAQTIRHFFYRFYQPDRILITAAGNIEHNQLVDLLAAGFEAIQPSEDGFPPRTIPKGRNSVMVQSKSLEQVHMCLSAPGIAMSDPDRFALSLLNTVLGGNMSSRLFQKIREVKGLAYTVYSFASSYQDTGMFGVYTAVNPDQIQTATELIIDELLEMRQSEISISELKDAKEYTKGNLYLASESPDNQMVRLAHNEFYFNRHVPLPEVIEKVEAITVEQIHQLAQKHFATEKLALSLLGPVQDAVFFDTSISE
ncbi:MAG: pitrilysin family protein, partial [Desulfobacteraceae bacterium]